MGTVLIPARGFRGALSFLTRVPTGNGPRAPEEIGMWVPFFPLVGALVGTVGALVYAGARELWSPVVAAALAVSSEAFVTGGLHEDGLGDTVDAFGGAKDRADARRILKDPRLGSFGVLALSLSVILRTAAVASLETWAAFAALPAAHALGRGAAISVLSSADVSAAGGLGATFAQAVTPPTRIAGIAIALVIGVITIGVWVLPASLACAPVAWWIRRGARLRIGGVTGDVLGAIQQCALVTTLLIASSVDGLPWWR